MVFAWIAMGIEIIACGCGIAQGGLEEPKKSLTARMASVACGLILGINIIWMANTASVTIRDSKEQIDNLRLVNECSDEVTKLPADQIMEGFDAGADQAIFAAHLSYVLLGTYAVSIGLILYGMKQ